MPDAFVPVPSTKKLDPFTKIFNALQIVKRASRDKTEAGVQIFLIRVATIMHFFTYANRSSLSFPPSLFFHPSRFQPIDGRGSLPLLLLPADSFFFQRRRAYANLTTANLKGAESSQIVERSREGACERERRKALSRVVRAEIAGECPLDWKKANTGRSVRTKREASFVLASRGDKRGKVAKTLVCSKINLVKK